MGAIKDKMLRDMYDEEREEFGGPCEKCGDCDENTKCEKYCFSCADYLETEMAFG